LLEVAECTFEQEMLNELAQDEQQKEEDQHTGTIDVSIGQSMTTEELRVAALYKKIT
jgi:hypothetical protein